MAARTYLFKAYVASLYLYKVMLVDIPSRVLWRHAHDMQRITRAPWQATIIQMLLDLCALGQASGVRDLRIETTLAKAVSGRGGAHQARHRAQGRLPRPALPLQHSTAAASGRRAYRAIASFPEHRQLGGRPIRKSPPGRAACGWDEVGVATAGTETPSQASR